MAHYTVNDMTHFSNNQNSFNVSNTYIDTDDRSQLLSWLSPLEPSLRHRDIRERRVNNVGEWLIQTEEFKSWCRLGGEGGGDNAVLFSCGNPGVGKTFISSLVVDRLSNQVRGQNTAITCFYFEFSARKEQSATNMLGSLVKQIVSGMERIPEEISRAFQEQKWAIGGCGPQLVDLLRMLQVITSTRPTFVCLDALDECVGVQRVRVLDSLRQILERSPATRIFVTGRPHIRGEMEKRLPGRTICLSICPTKGDIIEYLRARLGEDETPDAMNASLEAEILEKIPATISEMFLLVSLKIDSILQESTIHRRRERLRKMTEGLGLEDAYGATIERIKAQGGDKSRLGMEALMWISYAERPLSADELCHALAVELGSKDFNAENVPSISTLVSCCQGLLAVDKEASTVRLIHFTLVEYLSARPETFRRPHSTMAEICLTYLNSEQAQALSSNPFHIPETPFLGYCSRYWGVHAERELSDDARSLALSLLHEYDDHISAKWLLSQESDLVISGLAAVVPINRVHCASFFGIAEVLAALIEMGRYDINKVDLWGYTPLAWAARSGHEEAVRVLLRRAEVDPNKPDQWKRTSLSHAAGRGHRGVVEILLGWEEVNPDKPDRDGRTPLWYAAWGGHEMVLKALLGREVNPDRPDHDGSTPLSTAARCGREGVVKILLEQQQVDPDRPNYSGKTPLSYAAGQGHERVVKILLGQGEVNPDKPDNDGQTPLLQAAQGGHEAVVKILLGHEEVNPDKPDLHGTTPLSVAAQCGREGVVKILLGREQVNPGVRDNDGDIPLACAAYGGHEGVVKILLEQEGANSGGLNYSGRTPLSYAAWQGHEGVVEILLEQEQVNPDQADNDGQTPLMYAQSQGHQRVIELLQSREAVTQGSSLGPGDKIR